MKHFLSVYRFFFKINLAVGVLYRANFIQDVFGSLLWSGFSFATAWLITSRFPSVGDFSRASLIILASNYGIILGLHHTFFTGAFRKLAAIIHRGELDGYLLKPFDTLSLLTLSEIRYSSLFRTIGSILATVWLVQYYDLSITPTGVITFIFLTALSILMIYSLYCLAVIPLIWYPQVDNLLELLGNSIGTGRYPSATLPYMPKMLALYFLPFLLLVNIPTQALFGKLDPLAYAWYPAVCLGVFWLSRFTWKRALRSWSGAGS